MNNNPPPDIPEPTNSKTGSNPGRLLKRFALFSLFSALSILLLAGSGIYRIYSEEMILVAEETAVYVGKAIFEQERNVLYTEVSGQGEIAISPEKFNGLDTRMKGLLRTFNMFKIKVFSADKIIVYSTDDKIIGRIEEENNKLDTVLATGKTVSVLEEKEMIRDLKGEDRFNVDVVECYVPIRSGEGKASDPIVGAFEVYVDITSTHKRIIRALESTLSVLGVVLVTVFGLLFLPMRKGMNELKRVQDVLHQLASTDALTGVSNRRYLINRLQEERARILRYGENTPKKSIAFLMADIDHFKKVNDQHGHLAGDRVLQDVASRMKETLRVYDIMGRYGGEEFLIVLPHTSADEAVIVAERIRKSVCTNPSFYEGTEIPVSVSIGVAVVESLAEDVFDTIKRADEGLYRAKANGRNQICLVR